LLYTSPLLWSRIKLWWCWWCWCWWRWVCVVTVVVESEAFSLNLSWYYYWRIENGKWVNPVIIIITWTNWEWSTTLLHLSSIDSTF
jgi:hypothetical protein